MGSKKAGWFSNSLLTHQAQKLLNKLWWAAGRGARATPRECLWIQAHVYVSSQLVCDTLRYPARPALPQRISHTKNIICQLPPPPRGRRRGEGEGGASTGRKPGDSECARQLHWGLDVGEVYNRDIFPVLYSEPLFFGGWVGENGGLFAPDQNGTLRRHPGPMLE